MATTRSNTPNEPWTIGRLIGSAADYLKGKNVEESRLNAEILLAHALGGTRLQLYTRWTELVGEQVRTQFRELIKRAAEGEPSAYIVGHKEFFSMDFEVNSDVLIPRPETELLVERVISHLKEQNRPAWQVFEPGTGSGCIGIAIAREVVSVRLIATDISAEAVVVAQRNVVKHNLADRVTTAVADWLLLPAELVPPGGFDVIVGNPPYVGTTQTDMVNENVLKTEPAVALFGGADGLDFYRRTTREARPLLKPDGVLFCEVGWGDSEKVIAIFEQAGWRNTGRWKDLAGIERTLRFTLGG